MTKKLNSWTQNLHLNIFVCFQETFNNKCFCLRNIKTEDIN